MDRALAAAEAARALADKITPRRRNSCRKRAAYDQPQFLQAANRYYEMHFRNRSCRRVQQGNVAGKPDRAASPR
jgi:hypothetical protein